MKSVSASNCGHLSPHEAAVKAFHDKLAKSFSPDLDGYFPLWLELGILLRHCSVNDRVCDIGCANGSFTLRIAPHVTHVTGVDLSEEMLKEATFRADASHTANVQFRQGSAIQLPFPDASYDVSISYATLQFVAQPLDAIREMTRVVKPNGRVILDIRNRHNLSTRHWDKWQREHGTNGVSAFTWSEVQRRLPSLGLEMREVYAFGAGDQIQFAPLFDRLGFIQRIMHASKPPKPDLDYKLSNSPALFRLAQTWIIVATKASDCLML